MKRLAIVFAILMLVCALGACTVGERMNVDGATTTAAASEGTGGTTENLPMMSTTILQNEGSTTTALAQSDTTTETTTAAVTTTKTPTTVSAKTTTTKSTTTTKLTTVTQPSSHAPVEASVFDDAVIIGDSVTLKLSLYVSNQKNKGNYPLGQAKFLCSGSLGYTNALWTLNAKDNVHPRYNGVKYRIPDGVAATGAKKVFIMLGMNDFMLYGFDGTIESAEKLIGEIISKSPNAEIYVQSVTPILASKEGGSKTNANVRKLNTKIRAMCNEHGWTYLDVASVMVNSSGSLKSEYCGDPTTMGIHFTDAACQAWIDYLKKNV